MSKVIDAFGGFTVGSNTTHYQNIHKMDVEFEYDKAKRMATCCLCCFVPLSTMGIGCVCLPCMIHATHKGIESQRCTMSDTSIHYTGGWLNKVDMVLPMERVQDVVINQDCVSRFFGVQNIHFQNSVQVGEGQPGGVNLGAVKNVEMLRDFVLAKRDAITKPPAVVIAQATALNTPAGSDELTKLREQVAALESEKQQREIDALRLQVAQLQAKM